MSKSIKINVVMNLILSASSMIFPLITVPYVSRVLSVEANGAVSFAQSVTGFAAIFCTLGIQTYGIRACAQVRDDREALSRVVRELLLIIAICTTITMVIFAILVFTVPRFAEDKLLMAVFSVGIVLTAFGAEWFYQATEQYVYITVRSLCFKVIAIIGLFVLVRQEQDYVFYGAFIVFAASASNIFNMFRLIKSIDWSVKLSIHPLHHMKPIMVFFGNNLATSLYLTLDTILLGFFTVGSYQLGLYQLVMRLKNVILAGMGSISNAVLPRLSYEVRKHTDVFFSLLKKTSSFSILFSGTIAIYLFFMAQDIVLLLAGSNFIESVPSMQIMSFVIIVVAISGVTGFQILTPLGKEKYMTISTIIGAIIDIVLNVLLDPSMGAFGASLALLAAETTITAVQLVFCRKYIRESLDVRNVLVIVLSLFITACVLGMSKQWILHFNPFVNLLIGACFLGIAEMVMLMVLKENLVSQTLSGVLKAIGK
ncbi:flippase [Bifidobacterium scaligerum]|uniref:Flippase n=1 Tax=Bifidobacterium scaligerum TaxID=2052656 RepID=A0A2M9HPF2_9BIFI|nr:flippase [Bifidobacterium scaligerum]PJM78661.1 flippase [Bifidobacterium scaligerum]